jgi:hypothetical protein
VRERGWAFGQGTTGHGPTRDGRISLKVEHDRVPAAHGVVVSRVCVLFLPKCYKLQAPARRHAHKGTRVLYARAARRGRVERLAPARAPVAPRARRGRRAPHCHWHRQWPARPGPAAVPAAQGSAGQCTARANTRGSRACRARCEGPQWSWRHASGGKGSGEVWMCHSL